ncbi:MAG: hypothetical protein ACRDPY_25745 [Streptosporangiaceae bacterium]
MRELQRSPGRLQDVMISRGFPPALPDLRPAVRLEAKNIAKVATARELLTPVFYGLRDGRIRRLAAPGATPHPARAAA